jgi:ligand-binding sensor domain-containing protein
VVTALHTDYLGNVWLATEDGIRRHVKNSFVRLPLNQGIRIAMTTDFDGGLWLCDWDHGLSR